MPDWLKTLLNLITSPRIMFIAFVISGLALFWHTWPLGALAGKNPESAWGIFLISGLSGTWDAGKWGIKNYCIKKRLHHLATPEKERLSVFVEQNRCATIFSDEMSEIHSLSQEKI